MLRRAPYLSKSGKKCHFDIFAPNLSKSGKKNVILTQFLHKPLDKPSAHVHHVVGVAMEAAQIGRL